MEWRNKVLGASLLLTAVGCVSGESQHERGEALYGYCVQCHGDVGEGNAEFRAPAIAGLQDWYVEAQLQKFRIGARGAHPDDLDGLRMRPMSRTLATDVEVSQVSAYVASLDPVDPPDTMTGGDPAAGRALFNTCIECHGEDARGRRDKGAPSLINQSDWYLVAQLHKFRSGVRGSDTLDTTGIQMRPNALALENEQAVRDVVAYIETLDD